MGVNSSPDANSHEVDLPTRPLLDSNSEKEDDQSVVDNGGEESGGVGIRDTKFVTKLSKIFLKGPSSQGFMAPESKSVGGKKDDPSVVDNGGEASGVVPPRLSGYPKLIKRVVLSGQRSKDSKAHEIKSTSKGVSSPKTPWADIRSAFEDRTRNSTGLGFDKGSSNSNFEEDDQPVGGKKDDPSVVDNGGEMPQGPQTQRIEVGGESGALTNVNVHGNNSTSTGVPSQVKMGANFGSAVSSHEHDSIGLWGDNDSLNSHFTEDDPSVVDNGGEMPQGPQTQRIEVGGESGALTNVNVHGNNSTSTGVPLQVKMGANFGSAVSSHEHDSIGLWGDNDSLNSHFTEDDPSVGGNGGEVAQDFQTQQFGLSASPDLMSAMSALMSFHTHSTDALPQLNMRGYSSSAETSGEVDDITGGNSHLTSEVTNEPYSRLTQDNAQDGEVPEQPENNTVSSDDGGLSGANLQREPHVISEEVVSEKTIHTEIVEKRTFILERIEEGGTS